MMLKRKQLKSLQLPMQVLLSELKKLNKLLLTLPMLQLKDQRIFTTKLLRLPSILRIKLSKSETMFTMLYLKDLKLQKKSLLVLHTLLLKMHHMLLRKSKRKSAKLSKSFPVLLKVLNKQSHLLLQMQRMLPLKSKIKPLIKPSKSRIVRRAIGRLRANDCQVSLSFSAPLCSDVASVFSRTRMQ